jgi:hypothetical protein
MDPNELIAQISNRNLVINLNIKFEKPRGNHL